MYLNVYGEKVSRRRYREMLNAAKNRRELIAAGLTSRRDLFKMGLLTAGGVLVAKSGLSARAWGANSPGSFNVCQVGNQAASPPTRAFIEALPIMRQAQTVAALNPPHTRSPNTAAGEVRAADDQAFDQFPPQRVYEFFQQQLGAVMSPDLPVQTIWGFTDNPNVAPISPG